jgi:hypothetical protein
MTQRQGPGVRVGMLRAATALAVGLITLMPMQARSGIILDVFVDSSSATAGSTGNTFDVYVKNDSTNGESVSITGLSVDLTLPSGASYITFTNIDINTTLPYIFSITGSFLGGASTSVSPSEVMLNDASNASAGQSLAVGDSFGLARVTYSVSPGAPSGPVVVSLADLGGGTSLTLGPPDFAPYTPGPANGTITIQGMTATPEPSSLTMLAIAGIVGMVLSGRSRVRSRRGG